MPAFGHHTFLAFCPFVLLTAAASAQCDPSGIDTPYGTETFELVGVLSGKQITLYLDRFADNSPVRGAQIELEIGGTKLKAVKQGDDAYEVVLAEAPKPGVLPVTATVTAGNEADLLAGELDIHEAAHTDEAAHAHSWTEYAGWAVAGIAALGLLVWGGHRAVHARSVRAGAAA